MVLNIIYFESFDAAGCHAIDGVSRFHVPDTDGIRRSSDNKITRTVPRQ